MQTPQIGLSQYYISSSASHPSQLSHLLAWGPKGTYPLGSLMTVVLVIVLQVRSQDESLRSARVNIDCKYIYMSC